jgi:septal ring factor EnvC (AmiA/AmiB activator)
MPKLNYREESRKNWVKEVTPGSVFSNSELQLGAVLRIADSLEKIAQDKSALEAQIQFLKRGNEALEKQKYGLMDEVKKLKASNAAYKSLAKRLRQQLRTLAPSR